MMPKIVIVSGNHLCHNPRVLKEAEALSAAGYEVEVLGGWVDAELSRRDVDLFSGCAWKFVPVVDFTQVSLGGRIYHLLIRGRGRLGRACFSRFGWENPLQLGYAGPKLLKSACAKRAHLYIAHSEQAMWVAARLMEKGFKIGVDMEDWFSEDLLPQDRKKRPIGLLRLLERRLLTTCVHRTCTSHVMSNALAEAYGCQPPTVLYNAFAWTERQALDGKIKDRRNQSLPSIHWYSQTLGRGRGLEDLIAALPLLKHKAEIHLRGNPVEGFDEWFATRLPEGWRDRIFVHSLVTNEELLSRISEHDIGFAGEMKYCLSRDVTITNKILQYLLAGLAVVASDTRGHKEVMASAEGAGFLYPSGNPEALAAALNSLLESSDRLEAAKAAALKSARNVFCWEHEMEKLLSSVREALDLGVSTRSDRHGRSYRLIS